MWHVFRLALERGAESLTFFEDDLRFAKNALKIVAQVKVPEHLALVKWFDAFAKEFSSGEGVTEMLVKEDLENAFQGNCAMTIPKRTLEALVAHPAVPIWAFKHFGDGLMGLCLAGKTIGCYVPNPIQHIGAVSSVKNGTLRWGRVSTTFTESVWDTLLEAEETVESNYQFETGQKVSVEDLKLAIFENIKNLTPYSHLRIGIGEASLILRQTGGLTGERQFLAGRAAWTGADLDDQDFVHELRRAYAMANSIGYRKVCDVPEDIDKALSMCNVSRDTPCIDAFGIYRLFRTSFLKDIEGAHVLLVGSAAEDVARFLKRDRWKKAHNWNLETDAVSCSKFLGKEALDFALEITKRYKNSSYDLVLVGAGAPGKVICTKLAESGAVALDVGMLFEVMRGSATIGSDIKPPETSASPFCGTSERLSGEACRS
jgi:hypothetical protein